MIVVIMLLLTSGCVLGRRPPAPSLECPCTELNRLAIVSLENRNPIQLVQVLTPHAGLPFVEHPSTALRDLTLDQCEHLAAKASPISRQILSEASILCGLESTPGAAIELLKHQAAHERNQSAAQALRAYLGLVEVYLQHEVALASKQEIHNAAQTVDKLRKRQMTVPIDDGEFERRQFEIDERLARARRQQRQLVDQLDALLSLADTEAGPIWTNFQSTPDVGDLNLHSAVAVALEKRQDLAALESLAAAEDSPELLDWMRSAARSASPFLGMGAKLHGSRLARRLKGEGRAESNQRRCQMANAVQVMRDKITLEVRDALSAIDLQVQLIDLKRREIASLEDSIESAEKAKDIIAVDLPSDLEFKLSRQRMRSELIHEVVEYEAARVQLRAAQGLLGQSTDGSLPPCDLCK